MIYSIHYNAGHGNIENIRVCLAQSPELVNLQDDMLGDTPLIHAITQGQEQAVEFLLQNGADPLIQDEDGKNSLHILVIKLFSDNKSIPNEVFLNIAKQLILANPKILDQCEDSEWSWTPVKLAEVTAKVKHKPEIERMFLDVVRECVPNHPSVAPIQEPVEPDITSQEKQQSPADQELRHRKNVRTTTAQIAEQLITAKPTYVIQEMHDPVPKRSSWILSWITGKLFSGEVDQQKQPLLTSSTRSDSPSVEAY